MRIIALVLLTMLSTSGVVNAQSGMQILADDYIAQAGERGSDLQEIRNRLEADEYADSIQRELDIKRYLFLELEMLYLGKMAANILGNDLNSTNSELSRLESGGYIPFWPDNPLNDWEPTAVYGLEDGFAYGDLVLSLCPASEFTTRKVTGTAPHSFEIFIYGTDLETGIDREVWILQANQSWSQIPEGALYGRSFHMSSDAERARAKELTDPIIAAEKAAEAEKQRDEDGNNNEDAED